MEYVRTLQRSMDTTATVNRIGAFVCSRRGLLAMFAWYVTVSLIVSLFHTSAYTTGVLLPQAHRILDGSLPSFNVDPGLPLLMAGLLWAFGSMAPVIAVALIASLYAFGVWFLFRVLWFRGPQPWKRPATLVTIPLFILLPSYLATAGSLMQEGPFLACSLLGIAFIIRAEHNGTPSDAFAGGMWLSAANYFDYLWMPAPFFLMAWYLLARRPRSAGWAATVMVIMLLAQIPLLVVTQASSGEWSLQPPGLGSSLIEGNFPPMLMTAGSRHNFLHDPRGYLKKMDPDDRRRWEALKTAGADAPTELQREKARRNAFFRDVKNNTQQYAGVIPIKMPELLFGVPGWTTAMNMGGGVAAVWWGYRVVHILLMLLYLFVSWSLLRDATSLLFMGLYVCFFVFAFPLIADAKLLMAATPLAYWVAVAGTVKAWQEYRTPEAPPVK